MDRDPGDGMGGGGRGWDGVGGGRRGDRRYITLHCNQHNDFCIKMSGGESHFNVSFNC